MNEMFCFQCEQTANCSGCTGRAGVCGKSAATAHLQDELTGALVGLARAASGNEDLLTATTHTLVQEALFTTLTASAPAAAPAACPAAKPATTICPTCGAQTKIPVP